MKKTILYCFLLINIFCFAQGEANIWYFGEKAGLDFNSGSPVALSDGMIWTTEGCATISNGAGQLLFYTDGVRAWNRNHIEMTNLGLNGDYSSTQSAIIIPKPGSNNIYYIFTTGLVYNIFTVHGLHYSEVDMNLNGGLGNGTSIIPIQLIDWSCEKITAVKHSNNNDIWVISHKWETDEFYSYLVTASGVSAPIISHSGLVIDGLQSNSIGYLKASPDGTKLMCCNATLKSQLMDFNNTTGVVSNPYYFNNADSNGYKFYGAEFSPSGNLLYLTELYDPLGNNNVMFQYNLTNPNIESSLILIPNTTNPGALQLAPDGKIYLTQLLFGSRNFLGVINNPDNLGLSCNYQTNAVNLGTGNGLFGLPQFIQSYSIASFNTTNLCLGNPTNFSLTTSQIPTSILWNFGDGTPTSSATSPTHLYATAGTYTVTVTATVGGNTSTKSKSITISAVPIITTAVANQTVCSSVSATYNLASHNTPLLGGQSTATYGVAYFDSATNLTNHNNALATAYALPMGATTIYAKVYNLSNTACYAQSSFTVTKYLQPVANTITDMVFCQTPYTGTHQFDLSTKNNEVLGSQSATAFAVSYHSSLANAIGNISPLPMLYTNTLPTETIYARIENNSHTACYDTKSFVIKVISQPTISTVTNYKICDDASNDGFASFDLSTKTTEVLNGQSSTTFVVNYFLTNPDAVANTNAITAPITNTIANQPIYYSITANSNSGCKVISSFNLMVNPLPKANTPTAIYLCDTGNDNVENFNLSSQNNTILGTQNPANFTVSYHKLPMEANANSNPLPSSYVNISNPQTVYVRVTNNQNTACFDTTNFIIGLYQMPVAVQPTDLTTCDDASNDGKESFNLASQNNTILGTQNPANFSVSYHATQPEANSGANPLPSSYINTTTGQQTIYIRLTNNLSATCFDASKRFTLNVKPKPQIVMDDSYSICEGTFVDIPAPDGWSSYSWSKGTTVIGTLPTIRITVAGTYSLTVTKNYGTIICNDTKTFTVFNSNKAKITKIDINDWTDSENTIEVFVTGGGDYQYSLDNINFQDSSVFTGLGTGQYTIYVDDKKGCGYSFKDVFLLIYPKFFTPNGDGTNDYWKIKFSEKEPNLTVKIFDRFGTLMKELRKNSSWNGLNQDNSQVVSDDYWFVVTRQDGKIYKGHFALVR
jgi:gliding motility-associated-like protein